MRKIIKPVISYFMMVCIMAALCACGAQSFSNTEEPAYNSDDKQTIDTVVSPEEEKLSFNDLSQSSVMELTYATQFKVTYLDEYALITISDDQKFLVVPENKEIPLDVPKDIVILKKPLYNVYQISSSIMDMIRELDRLDRFSFTGTKRDDWYVKEVVTRMDDGSLKYAGKYSQPDYELLLAGNCSLAIENTMIWHSPEAKEKLESLGIPVLVETSNYESHPLGRLEWIKLYGLLFDCDNEAASFFDNQISLASAITSKEKTDKTVAMFYVTSNGAVNVKKPGDYVAKIIEMAGATYIPGEISGQDENAMSTINMTLEDFYAAVRDADIIIYNSTVTDEIKSYDELMEKSPVFADFKAVKEKKVYCCGNNFYQQTTHVCYLIEDINNIINDKNDGLHFVEALN